MDASLQSNRRVTCTYANCSHSFYTEDEMKLHKKEDPDHFYCRKCDVDCSSWVDLTQHKVDLMVPFIDGKMKGSGEHPKHIVCEFCGEDFRSFGGRKRHREIAHPADQSITCRGCFTIFVRASHMIEHLERNQCGTITAYDFRCQIQKKYIMDEVLENPDVLIRNLNRLGRPATQSELPTITSSASITIDEESSGSSEDGGTALLDETDEEQNSGYDPLKAELPRTRQNLETWPRLPGLGPAPEVLTQRMSKLSIRTHTAQAESGSETNSWPAVSSDKTQKPLSTRSGGQTPWTAGNSSRALFPIAKPTPPSASPHMTDSNNLFNLDVCNFKSNEFDAHRFWDPTVDRYICPFFSCRRETFASAQEIREHFRWGHTKVRFVCPACLKVYYKPSALVAHAESSGTCNIRKADQFSKLVDDISGGFLTVKSLHQPAVYHLGTDLVKTGKATEGVMLAKFDAKMPGQSKQVFW